jgi:tetratricopeptide (TPR) repeat protein
MSGQGEARGWEAVRLDELDSVPIAHGLLWHPIRRRLGIRAFGINAYTSESIGGQVVEEHDETGGATRGHEEVYLVVRGRATFTIDGEALDAPAGTLVFLSDPAARRGAVAEEEGTLVLAVGAEPGVPYEPSAWEWSFSALPALKAGRYDEAIAMLEEGLRERPGHAALLYNLACAESRGGRAQDALEHLRRAIEGDAKLAAVAQTDPDFDSIRAAPGFPR